MVQDRAFRTRQHRSAAINTGIAFLGAGKQNSRIVDHMQAARVAWIDMGLEVHELYKNWAFGAVLSPFQKLRRLIDFRNIAP